MTHLPRPSSELVPQPPPLVADRGLAQQRTAFLTDGTARAMLEAMPGPALVLNSQRQVVAVNRHLLRGLSLPETSLTTGPAPGDLFGCRQAAAGACGSMDACEQCGANRAILECAASRQYASHECRILTQKTVDGGALDFRAHASAIDIAGEAFIIVGLQDVSSEKRRRVLERTFFHDLLNACGGMQGLAEMLIDPQGDPAAELELKHDLHRLSGFVIEQIASQRQLLAAERGELSVNPRPLELAPFLGDIVALYAHHEVAEGRSVRLQMDAPVTVTTDGAILGRVIGNLVKNALEATRKGGTVVVRCTPGVDLTTLSVHNPGFIPREIQLQIFQRSFSTKGGEGRGIGTYSVRLFAEQYLHGSVGFQSTEESGTVFELTIPNELAESAAA